MTNREMLLRAKAIEAEISKCVLDAQDLDSRLRSLRQVVLGLVIDIRKVEAVKELTTPR